MTDPDDASTRNNAGASPVAMLAELPESEATGEIAVIYREIRDYFGVPYVSTLQRHVATMPGCLEWMWAALRPGVVTGELQETAWRLAEGIDIEPLPPLSDAAVRLLGVDAASLETVHDIYEMYARVSPCNLIFSACARLLLTGTEASGPAGEARRWQPPPMVAELPAMPAPGSLDPDIASLLNGLGRDLGGQVMVPGLYRTLALWPAYFAHVASELGPLLRDRQVYEAGIELAARITDAAPGLVAKLPPPPPGLTRPDAAQTEAIIAALDVFKTTSPEMVIFSTLLKRALPAV